VPVRAQARGIRLKGFLVREEAWWTPGLSGPAPLRAQGVDAGADKRLRRPPSPRWP
jgi:hypothetical protein